MIDKYQLVRRAFEDGPDEWGGNPIHVYNNILREYGYHFDLSTFVDFSEEVGRKRIPIYNEYARLVGHAIISWIKDLDCIEYTGYIE